MDEGGWPAKHDKDRKAASLNFFDEPCGWGKSIVSWSTYRMHVWFGCACMSLCGLNFARLFSECGWMYIEPNTAQCLRALSDDTSRTPKKTLFTGRPSTSVHVFANFEPGKDNLSSDRWNMIKVVIVDNVMIVTQCKNRNRSSILKLVQKVESRTTVAAQRRMLTREASKLILDIWQLVVRHNHAWNWRGVLEFVIITHPHFIHPTGSTNQTKVWGCRMPTMKTPNDMNFRLGKVRK